MRWAFVLSAVQYSLAFYPTTLLAYTHNIQVQVDIKFVVGLVAYTVATKADLRRSALSGCPAENRTKGKRLEDEMTELRKQQSFREM